MKRLAIIAAIAGTLVATLVAVSSALAASSLTGVYVTTVKGKSPAELNGVWAMAIGPTGSYAIEKKGVGVLVNGHAVIAGKKITFGREIGPAACKGSQATADYTWSLSGKKLKLKLVKDTCVGRRAVLTSSLTKVQ